MRISYRTHFHAVSLDTPSFRRFGGASDSKDVEPERFRAGLVATCSVVVGVEAGKVSALRSRVQAAVAPVIVLSPKVPLATDADAFT